MNKQNKVQLVGTSYEIGYQHGKTATNSINNSLKTYEKMFSENAGMTWDEAYTKA
ncbi:hypothetical protein [Virgibacillus salexigens]|uniref:Uncharacterized protein n=1 Tax=Virgibacillus kapii TaxID=1638645 RepID=A0ABQ2D1Q2_9BACI|nr:hypothetical protein [Virgibacillus kapii]GGJ41997.1 hypothetical protein GCM10007111_00270 [Virgibacillus kapii]